MRKAAGFLSVCLGFLLAANAFAQSPQSDLAQRVAATGLEGGWAGTVGNVDVCSILVEEWAVEGDRVRYQARLVSGGQQPDPVYYEIVSVVGNRITLSRDTVLTVDGDQLTSAGSSQTRHRCTE
jgi:hypothetical protein